MNLFQLFKNVSPFVKPYKGLVFITLLLTLIGSLMAQVNAIVLDWTVDQVNGLVTAGEKWGQRAAHIVILISSVLLGKEILSALITFAQNYFGERMRIFVSRDLAQSVIEKVLTFKMAFFNTGDNATGKLQARIDQGVSSLSRTVQNFFIDLLPLFTSALHSVFTGAKSFPEIGKELDWLFIHTDNRFLFVIGSAVYRQYIFHCRDKCRILAWRNTPALLQVRLKFVFLRMRETVTWEMSLT